MMLEKYITKEEGARLVDVVANQYLGRGLTSQKMNLSKARVCQIRRNALEKMKKREGESLDRIAIENIVKKMIAESTTIHLQQEELDYVYSEKKVAIREYYAHPLEKETRIEALLRDMKDVTIHDYRRAAVLIETSPDYLLLMEELDRLHGFFQKFPELAVKWGIGKEMNLGNQVNLLVIYSF